MKLLMVIIFFVYALLLLKFRVKSRVDANAIAKDLVKFSRSIRNLMPFRVVYNRDLTIESPKSSAPQARDTYGRFASPKKEEEENSEERWTRIYYVNSRGETVKRSEIE